MIDCHCHMEYMDEPVVEEAQLRMSAVITSVAHPKDVEKTLNLAKKYPGFVYVALGLHPTEVSKFTDEQIEDYTNLIRNNKNKIVAIGEVGLDRHWIANDEEHERSKRVFKKFIELANELKLPLVVHSRDAMGETLQMLAAASVPVMMHCFSSRGHIEECKKMDYFMSMNTIICKSKSYSKIARDCPLELMLLETDAPWMDPSPDAKGLTNKPWNIEKAAEKIASLKNITKQEVLEATTRNAKKLFGI